MGVILKFQEVGEGINQEKRAMFEWGIGETHFGVLV
jgi:hypothetical protein